MPSTSTAVRSSTYGLAAASYLPTEKCATFRRILGCTCSAAASRDGKSLLVLYQYLSRSGANILVTLQSVLLRRPPPLPCAAPGPRYLPLQARAGTRERHQVEPSPQPADALGECERPRSDNLGPGGQRFLVGGETTGTTVGAHDEYDLQCSTSSGDDGALYLAPPRIGTSR